MLPAHLPHFPPPTKGSQHSHDWQEGPSLNFQLYHSKVDPALNPKQGQEERDQILWNTHGGGLWTRCPGLMTPILTGGRRLKLVWGPAWEHTLCRRDTMISWFNTTYYGKWQPSTCQWHNKMPQGGGMPFLCSFGLTPRTSCLPLQPQAPRISGSSGRRRHWLWPGHYRPVQRHQGPRQASSVGLPESSSSAWPLWSLSMGTILLRPL